MSTNTTAQSPKSRLTKEASEALRRYEQDESALQEILRVLFYEAKKNINRSRGWISGRKPQPQDIAADAVNAIWHGQRTWDPSERSLLDECRRIIPSLVSNARTKKSQQVEGTLDDDGEFAENGNDTIDSNHDPLSEIEARCDSDQAQSLYNALASDGLSVVGDSGASPIWNLGVGQQLAELYASLPTEPSAENLLLKRVVDEIALSYPEREPATTGELPRKANSVNEELAVELGVPENPTPNPKKRSHHIPGWANEELALKLGVSEEVIVNVKKRLRRLFAERLWNRFLAALPDDGRPWRALADTAERPKLPSDWLQCFADNHSLTVDQVIQLGVELVQRFRDWFPRSLRDAKARDRAAELQERANAIEKNIQTHN